jgi:hypothetical protein
MNEIEALEFYAVRNKEGKWFRAKGYGGYGETWVKEIGKARIYNRIGPARATISYFANTYPKYGIPDLVLLKCTEMKVLDETERVLKQKNRKELAEKKQKMEERKWKLEEAKRNLEEAQKEFEKLSPHGKLIKTILKVTGIES